MMRRREFLIGCTAAVCTLGATCDQTDQNGPVEPNRDGFLQLTGESFRVLDEDLNVVYADLLALEDHGPAEGRDQYELVLRTAAPDLLEPGLYEFYHTRTGSFHAYMEPVQMDETGLRYEILFNQFH